MAERPANDGKLWMRDELVIAFELYCRTPFRKTKANNPEVRRAGLLLGRTPASVARKLGNFGAFDPQLRERGISGLVHGSHLDREVWEEFHRDWNSLVEEAHRLRESLGERRGEDEPFKAPTGPSERMRISRERIHQSFFREAVLERVMDFSDDLPIDGEWQGSLTPAMSRMTSGCSSPRTLR